MNAEREAVYVMDMDEAIYTIKARAGQLDGMACWATHDVERNLLRLASDCLDAAYYRMRKTRDAATPSLLDGAA